MSPNHQTPNPSPHSATDRFSDKWEAVNNKKKLTLNEWNHVVLHSPYNKLVKKSGARMVYNDFIRDHNLPMFKKDSENLRHPSPLSTLCYLS